mgnify:CR=1 FL=1
MKIAKIKKNIREELFKKLSHINGVISVTLVGSFVDKENLAGISDIDTIVICKSLNEKFFNSCLNAVTNIDLEACELDGYNIKINSTFGPLKFDKPNQAVIHLMIYDINAPRRHVLSSPFTCYDWERSATRVGPSLKEIFPAGMLQFRDFMEVRRSLENYINDLNNNIISYREYDFNAADVLEIKKNRPLDERHQGEYSYHIVRNLIANYLKLCNNKNDSFTNSEIKAEIKRLFSIKGEFHAKKFDTISAIKFQRANTFPQDTVKWAKSFLNRFQKNIKLEWANAVTIYFIRHYQTNLNNGSYLGQSRDPSINKNITLHSKHDPVSMVYSSPLRRCLETTSVIYEDSKVITDDRLIEFDYGLAEGLQYDDLIVQFPEIPARWKQGEDPCFPEGENTSDVFNRISSFLTDLSTVIDNQKSGPISIVTHNGLLRCLLGNAIGLELKDWYKLVIPHGVQLEFLYYQDIYYPNIPRTVWAEILQNVGYTSE